MHWEEIGAKLDSSPGSAKSWAEWQLVGIEFDVFERCDERLVRVVRDANIESGGLSRLKNSFKDKINKIALIS
jgi:hypothetical protein